LNFFGHAVVASWADPQAKHLLGSMLPDFETMLGVPLSTVRDADVERGIELHHRTDDAFHRAPAFLASCAHALDALTEAGVRRGTARAVGHIGTEMLLDGWLVREERHVEGYLRAIELETSPLLDWGDRGTAFSKLQARLAVWGAPRDYAEPEFVLARIGDALRPRPALALLEEQSAEVANYLPALQRLVEQRAPELLKELQDALGFGD
jgi:acyl carrier protein phosphodiesterase